MKIIGHRGAMGIAPENTLEAFQKAIDCQVDTIETDVRLTSDGKLVLVHKHLPVELGRPLRIAQTPYDEVMRHDDRIITLEQAIAFIDRRVRLMVEVKKGVPTAPVVKVIKKFLDQGWQPTDFMFNSASYQVLKELKTELPAIERIIQGNWSGVRVQWLARRLDTPYILLDQQYIWWGYVAMVSKRYKLITYTYFGTTLPGFDHFKTRKWEKHGLYGVVTDYPNLYTKK
ncbi:MAG: glycerophosphodiester phosphodiesterase [Candidatus Saccharibacteria bacterium]|nr:glycerophosphodiester phosphodiesterase [Candidatus Saccharibacteria bacterium]